MKALYAKNAVEAFKKMIKQKQPEKVWTDKGFIYIQPKTKPSRHLLRGIFDHSKTSLTNTWRTWTYNKELLQFVNTINSRVNRVAPNKIFKKHEPFLISLAISTKNYKPKYDEEDLVRIAKPDEIFRNSYKQNCTDEVFRVFKVATLSPPTYNLIDANNVIIEGIFYEPE